MKNINDSPILATEPGAIRSACQNRIPPCRGVLTILGLGLLIAAGHAQIFTTIKSFGIFTNITGFNPQSTLVQGADGMLYGTAVYGEGPVSGTVFKVQPDGSGFATLKFFTNRLEGIYPYAGLALSGSTLFGTTGSGGSSNYGTVFRVNTDGTGYTVLKHFGGSDGARPYVAALTLSDSVLYGATYGGGSAGDGTVFKLNTDGSDYTVLHSFTGVPDGAFPDFALTVSGSVLYGTTENGGSAGAGTVFTMNTDGTGYAVLVNFTNSPDGAYADAVLTLSGGVLYGTTYRGGSNYDGTIFQVNTDGTGYSVLKHFGGSDGAQPTGPLILSGGVLYGTTSQGGSNSAGTVFQINTDGTGFSVLNNFTNSPDGATPLAGMMLSGSLLYGTTRNGGEGGVGSVFQINTNGSGYSILGNFARNGDGSNPNADLTMSGGVLYGTTSGGGSSGGGTVFKVNTNGTGYMVLKHFAGGNEGASPSGTMPLSGNVLYGITQYGGSTGAGTVFKLNTDGTGYTVLKNFTNDDGATPLAGLTLSGGVLYGTTAYGGSANLGTVFQLNTDGTGYAVLKRFANEGSYPFVGVMLSGSVIYGTTEYGGTGNNGTVFKVNVDGTGYTVLKTFIGSDGSTPDAVLALSGSALYGTTHYGGISNAGTVFMVNTDGTGFSTVRHFTDSPDGAFPDAGVVVSGSTLYGTTIGGGSWGYGTVFKMNTNGTGFSLLKNYDGTDGMSPHAALTLSSGLLYGTTQDTVFKVGINGIGYTVLHYFSGSPDGQWPWTAGVVLLGSALYGTTSSGGTSNYGTVFRVQTDGTGYAVMKNFTDGSDGAYPYGGLVLSGSVLYGTTYVGGNGGGGTVFKISTSGFGFTVLHSFAIPFDPSGGIGGFNTYAGLALSGNVLYGTTTSGGGAGQGTVFKLNTDGTGYTVVKSLANDGKYPGSLAVSGTMLYGTTEHGGNGGNGTVFALNTDGTGFTNLYSFTPTFAYPYWTNSDGAGPVGKLAISGNILYGATAGPGGGAGGRGTVFAIGMDGTGFRNLYSFTAAPDGTNSDGANPEGGLVLSGNTLYGTAAYGGISQHGTVFSINTDGTCFTTVYSFSGDSDGSEPYAGLIQSGNSLYGTTAYGGSLREGTVFSLSFRPQLNIAPSVGNVILSWQSGFDFGSYTLQSTTNLAPPVVWNTNLPAPIVVNGQLAVTDLISSRQKFYRLVQ